MKKYYFILSIIISIGLLSGCNKNLDYNEISVYDDEWVFNNEGEVSGLLGVVYAHVRFDLGDFYGGAMLASATDEADFTSSLSSIHRYYNGAWSSVNAFGDTWNNSYSGIYAANDFLEKLDKVFETLDIYKYNTSSSGRPYEQMRKRFELFPFQARFLRAYFHFELAKTYGNVPLITRTLTHDEANRLTRTPVQEVFQFIVDECDAIMEFLPISYAEDKPGSHIGRVNRPTILALKARTLLYAASPLFNPENPREAWRKAAVASKELIDYAPGWGIELSPYNSLWGPRNHYDVPEIIWFRHAGNTNQYAMYNFPVGYENTRGGNCPTQNLVDAYEYNNSAPADLRGKTWPQAEANGNLPANPYQNLDPRFAWTVARSGDTWPTVEPYSVNPLETYEGGRNAAPTVNATKTGYYLKKYVNGGNRVVNPEQTSYYSWIIYRLGEFYLNYAEAVFNYMGSDATAIPGGNLDMSANDAINEMRSRLNMPLFGAETNGNAWVERYKRERMVELAFEGHRFWDVRRWKTGGDAFMKIKTINVRRVLVPGTENEYMLTYSRGPEINRGQWQEKYNLYPIPFGELRKAESLEQNPGWEER